MRRMQRQLFNWILLAAMIPTATHGIAATPAQASQAANAAPGEQEADPLFQASDWAGTAKAYEAIVKSKPADGQAWFRLGVARHSLGEYAKAVEAFEKAASNGNPAPVWTARAQARAGNKERALELLRRAVANGFAVPQLLQNHPDFAGLREDAPFGEIVAQAARNSRPCENNPAHRQFDFWVGEWDVEAQGAVPGAPKPRSSIQNILAGCVIFENWMPLSGAEGKSFNYFNRAIGKWEQVWVATNGSVLKFVGEVRDGNMYYSGENPGPHNTKVLDKMTFFNLGPDRVRQLWEQSSDNGKTWAVVFDGMYVRRTKQEQ